MTLTYVDDDLLSICHYMYALSIRQLTVARPTLHEAQWAGVLRKLEHMHSYGDERLLDKAIATLKHDYPLLNEVFTTLEASYQQDPASFKPLEPPETLVIHTPKEMVITKRPVRKEQTLEPQPQTHSLPQASTTVTHRAPEMAVHEEPPELLADHHPPAQVVRDNPPAVEPAVKLPDIPAFPELPESLRYAPELARQACGWLDNYIAFSRKWSPRAYDGYHEAVGIALLSTVAARRVVLDYGGHEYTPMYIALVGPTTLFKKTTTARLFYGLLSATGLEWLLGANITTPTRLLSDMAGKSLPINYSDLSLVQQNMLKQRLALSGQRGWYYEEFGLHLDAMVRESGPMSDFKGLLRILDDCQLVFEYATQTRGVERIEKPYLSLLCSMTPADLRPHAGPDHKFWRDGLFARFAFVCPPYGAQARRDPFPEEELVYPQELTRSLRRWHERLGMPEIEIGKLSVLKRAPLPEYRCRMTPEVAIALRSYEFALLDMIEQKQIPEAFYGSYGRLHKMALRVAMLLASFQNEGVITIAHWARGQQFAEARRADLHELMAQMAVGEELSPGARLEDSIIKCLKRREAQGEEAVSVGVLCSDLKKDVQQTEDKLRALSRAGMVVAIKTSRTTKYRLIKSQES